MRTTFELADTLYAEAELEETDTVYLWLGVRKFIPVFFSVAKFVMYLGQRNVVL